MKTPQDLAAATTQFSLSPQLVCSAEPQSTSQACLLAHTSQDAAQLPLTLSPHCQGTALCKRGRPEFLQSSRPWKTSRSTGPALTKSFAAEADKGSHSTRHTSSFASEQPSSALQALGDENRVDTLPRSTSISKSRQVLRVNKSHM